MLSFRKVGKQGFENYVKYNLLKYPTTVKAPLHQHRLLTMASKKKRKPKSTPKERAQKQEVKCLKLHLVWSNHQESPKPSEVQYSVLPWAMSDEDGNPHKGQKSGWTSKLASRYCLVDLTTTYIIQLNLPHSDESKYNFQTALLQDMDLSNLQQDVLCVTLQTLFICTGCDYVSYFKSIGKATNSIEYFLSTRFLYM